MNSYTTEENRGEDSKIHSGAQKVGHRTIFNKNRQRNHSCWLAFSASTCKNLVHGKHAIETSRGRESVGGVHGHSRTQ